MSAIKRSISAPADLYAKADQRQLELGYSTFSDYIQALIRADTLSAAAHVRETAPEYKTSSLQEAEQKIGEAVKAEGQRLLKKAKKTK